ncbi:malonic semialdehyde reductase [Conyzicola sp.]|uniref:malonic semialdehyde reductase n=1 Tax=Conyzicola sp. TaxID=1969404 RepID=UPI003988E4AC
MTDIVDLPTHLPHRLDDEARAQLFTDARTASSFAPTPVTEAELAEIWDLAKWAPTAANFQPLRVTYVNSESGRARLVSHMAEGNKAKTLAAPAVAVLAFDSRFHEHIPTVAPFRAALVPVMEENEEMRIASSRFNSALQAGYFVLAVRALGFAAGPMGGFDADALDAEFFPDGRFRSTLVVNIGHPTHDSYRDRGPRLDHSDVVHWA